MTVQFAPALPGTIADPEAGRLVIAGPGTLDGAVRREWFDPCHIPFPAVARMRDFWLGGLCHWAADRALADEVAAVWPGVVEHVWAGELLYRRMIARLLRAGIRQVVDIGPGLLRSSLVHDIARMWAVTTVRAVYVDVDPIAVAYSAASLADRFDARAVHIDQVDAATVLDHPDVVDLVDFAEPVAVILRDLHHRPHHMPITELLRDVTNAVTAGSYLAVSGLCRHSALDDDTLTGLYGCTPTGLHLRDRDDLAAGLAGVPRLRLLAPGLVPAHVWHPDIDSGPAAPALVAGLAHIEAGDA